MAVTPDTIESEIRRLARKLESRTDDLAELFQAAAAADVAYRVEFARALLTAEGKTAGEREAVATLHCERLLMARRTSEAVADSARESVRSLRDQISAVQSVGAMVRSQMELSR